MNLSKFFTSLVILLASLMSACSKDDSGASTQAINADTKLPITTQPSLKPAAVNINLNTPLDQYITVNESYWARKIDGGSSEFILVYYALCNCTVDYDEIALNLSEEFRLAKSAFDRNAILNRIRPDIDAQLAKLKASPFVKFTSWWVTLGNYDFDKKSFPVATSNLYDDIQKYSLDVRHINTAFNSEFGRDLGLRYINARSVKYIYAPDESQARQIESLNQLGLDSPLRLVIYGYAHSAGIEKFKVRNTVDDSISEVSKRVISIQVVKYSLNNHEEVPFGNVLAGPFAITE